MTAREAAEWIWERCVGPKVEEVGFAYGEAVRIIQDVVDEAVALSEPPPDMNLHKVCKRIQKKHDELGYIEAAVEEYAQHGQPLENALANLCQMCAGIGELGTRTAPTP